MSPETYRKERKGAKINPYLTPVISTAGRNLFPD